MIVYRTVYVILSFTVVFLLFIISHTISNNAVILTTISSSSMNLYNYDEINYTIFKNTKTILYWDTFYGNKTMGLGLGAEIFKNCVFNNCLITFNKDLIQVQDFDAVLFHGARYESTKLGKPMFRSGKQKYIFYSWESYFNTYIDNYTVNDFYNWTMTFRRDSDIYYPYNVIEKQRTNYVLPNNKFINNKTKMVAWLASNCYTAGGKSRKKYVKELMKYIPVDIYGNCGSLSCPNTDTCYKMFENNYKFYLSFENSFCPDYVTEKLFNLLKYNIIPVVWGGANYSKIVPPNSVINAREFESTNKLAQYLKHVASNNTLYLQYFTWKNYYTVNPSQEYALCELCKKLNEPVLYTSYKNIKRWYHENCTNASLMF